MLSSLISIVFLMCNEILYFKVPRNISVSLSTGGFFFCTKSRRSRRELVGRRASPRAGGTIDPKETHPNSHTRFGDYDFLKFVVTIKMTA